MQDTNEDTQWNDILRQKGIIGPKEAEVTEADIVNMIETTIEEKSKSGKELRNCDLDELDELEDDEDEAVILEYRRMRIAQIRAEASKDRFGDVMEISAVDYVNHVNNAGEDIWVVLHLYKQGIPLCALLNQHLSQLAAKFPTTKFLKSIASTCIPNYPDRNLPSIFIYFEGNIKKQLVGPLEFRGMSITVDELEWILSQTGAVTTKLTEDPRPKVRDVLFSKLKNPDDDDLADSNDW